MRFHNNIILSITLLLIASLYSCLSSKIYPDGIEPSASMLKDQPYEILGDAEGQSSSFALFWFVTVTPRADIDRAISDIVSDKGGNALIDVRWWIERKIYIVGAVTIIHIKGKVIRYID